MSKVVNLNVARADRAGDNMFMTPKDMLAAELETIDQRDPYNRAIVIYVHEDDREMIATGYRMANLSLPEAIAMLEVLKAHLMKDLID